MVNFDLTGEEAELLSDCIDFFLEGHEQAEEQVAQDRTHRTPEEMMEAASAMRQQRINLIVLQERIRENLIETERRSDG